MTTKERLENICSNCKNLSVIISQACNYYCYYKNKEMDLDDFIRNCEGFEEDNRSLNEKEERVWG